MAVTFVDERLDEAIEQGAQGGPTFMTTVLELAGGTEKRNIEWERPRQQWDLSYGIQDPADMEDVIALFYICHGRALGFRFKDWTDYTVGVLADPDADIDDAPQSIGQGASGNTTFQIFKRYAINTDFYDRIITRPISGTLKVWVAGVLKTETTHYTVNYATGLITFVSAPADAADVSVVCEFDVPVRFDTDTLTKKVTWVGAQEIPSIPIIELKE